VTATKTPAQVTAREEAKKKALATKKDVKKQSKARLGAAPANEFRGAMQGADSEPSAFWMVMEVGAPLQQSLGFSEHLFASCCGWI
jgi:hypothetical protein